MKVKHVISAILVIFFLTVDFTPSYVYAYCEQDVVVHDKQSNCGENIWNIFPRPTIEKIECGPGNKLSVTVAVDCRTMEGRTVNSIDIGFWEDVWKGVGEVYFDGKKMGVFDIINPTTSESGYVRPLDGSYSSYTYPLPWEITAQVMVVVKVTISATRIIEEEGLESSGGQNISAQAQLKPLYTASNKGIMYLAPLLLGLIGLSIVVWAGYLRYGTQMFRIARLFRCKH